MDLGPSLGKEVEPEHERRLHRQPEPDAAQERTLGRKAERRSTGEQEGDLDPSGTRASSSR